MRASRFVLSLALYIMLPALPVFPAAGLPVQDDCDPAKVERLPPSADFHPLVIYNSQRSLMDADQWADVARNIEEGVERSAVLSRDGNYRHFLGQVRAMRSEFDAIMSGADYPKRIKKASGVNQMRFAVERDDTSDVAYLFKYDPAQITITAQMDPEVRKEYCWRSLGVNKILTRYGQDGRNQVATTLQSYVKQWDAFNENGYLQYPWELLVNGAWFPGPEPLAPPKYQMVLLHPGFGVEQAGRSFERSRLDEVVLLEPIGMLRYTDTRESYFGISALLTLSSDRDVGKGVLIHFGKNAKLGFVWRDKDELNHAQNGVVFSMDLYQMLADAPKSQRDRMNRVKDIYSSTMSGKTAAE